VRVSVCVCVCVCVRARLIECENVVFTSLTTQVINNTTTTKDAHQTVSHMLLRVRVSASERGARAHVCECVRV
jgi:hypothetical protein